MSIGSLRFRLLLGAAAFIFAAVSLAAIGLALLFERHVERWINDQLNARLDQLIAGIELGPDGTLIVARPPPDPRFEQPYSGLYWQVGVEPPGPPLRSRSLWDYEIPLPAERDVDDASRRHEAAGPNAQRLYLLQRRVELPERLGGKTVRVAVALDQAELRAAVWNFATALVPFLLLLAVLLTLAAYVQVAIGLRPLAAMRERLEAIRRGEADRLGAGFPEEVQPLARGIDELLDARDGQIETARARATDLAHGLKTSLQVLVGDARRLRAKGESEISDEIEDVAQSMQRHVERQLARERMAVYDPKASADVAQVVERIIRVMERTPKGQGLSWLSDVADGIKARIDAEDLAEAVGNLIENAVRHARTRVAVSGRQDAEAIVLTIADDGPGIPKSRQQEALRRGSRLDTQGPGAGLGLSIVGEIAENWGGTLSLSQADREFRVSVRLPAATRRHRFTAIKGGIA